MKRLRVHDRVMTSHDACTSATSRVLTVASLQRLKTEILIPAPADCEVRSVLKVLNAQGIAIEIHRQLCEVYGPNVMNKKMVGRWYRQFTAGRQCVHAERSGTPSIITDDLVELVRERLMENRLFTIMELSNNFPQISRSLLHKIITVHPLFIKLCDTWVPKRLTPEHKVMSLEPH